MKQNVIYLFSSVKFKFYLGWKPVNILSAQIILTVKAFSDWLLSVPPWKYDLSAEVDIDHVIKIRRVFLEGFYITFIKAESFEKLI